MIQNSLAKQFKNDSDTDSQKNRQSDTFSGKQDQNYHSKNIVSVEKILDYFKFYQQFLQSNFDRYHPKKAHGYQQTQISRFIQQSKILYQQNSIQSQKQQLSQQISKKTLIFLSHYQSFHRQTLQKRLLKSGRFKKVQSFTSQLLIYEINPSKHYEIVKLGVQLSCYRTQILILNSIQKTPLNQLCEASQHGSFGIIYFVRVLNEQIAIKCTRVSKQDKISNQQIFLKSQSTTLQYMIKQLFFSLIFSQLQIGPEVKTIGGFDIIIDDDYLQFAMQVCHFPDIKNQQQLTDQITLSLFEMHMLKIVHRDVKPSNIMYSPTFKKHVFIDFGCTDGLKESLGMRSLTKFTGATGYCSDEMFDLLSQNKGFVDLYYNDICGLKKSICQKYGSSIDQEEINNLNCPVYQLSAMKFNLFVGDYERFYEIWRYLNKKYCDYMEDIQIELMEFFKELKITENLRNFYWKQINQNLKSMKEFTELNTLMKSQGFDLLSEISTFSKKQSQFKTYRIFLQRLKVKCSDYTSMQNEIELILMSKEKILEHLSRVKIKMSELIENDTVKLCLVVAIFSSFAQNRYLATIDQKLDACTLAIQFLQLQNHPKSFFTRQIIPCQIERLQPISKFYQYFVYDIGNLLPQRYKYQSLLNAIINLLLLGYPMNIGIMSLFIDDQKIDLERFFQESREQQISKNELIEKYFHYVLEKNPDQIQQNIFFYGASGTSRKFKQTFKKNNNLLKLKKISFFWQCELVYILYDNIFYRKQKLNANFGSVAKILQLLRQKQKRQKFKNQQKNGIQKSKHDIDFDQIFALNEKFENQIIINYHNFNQTTFKDLLQQLQKPSILQFQSKSIEVKKWRSLMQILLCCFVFVYSTTNGAEILMDLKKQVIFNRWYQGNILSYSLCLFFYQGINVHLQQKILGKIDEIINQKQISLRYELCRKVQISLAKGDYKFIRKVSILIENEMKKADIWHLSQSALFISLIRLLSNFIDSYLQNTPKISNDFIQMLKNFYPLVKLGWQVGTSHSDPILSKKWSQILSVQNLPQSMVSSSIVQNLIRNDQLSRCLFHHLLILSKIYQKALVKYPQLSSQNEPIIIDEKYHFLFKWIEQNRNKFKFSIQWYNVFNTKHEMKNIILSNRLLLLSFLNFYFESRNTRQEILLGEDIIRDLFGEMQPHMFLSPQNYKILPSFQIAFDYYQIKLIKSNYGRKQCEQILQLYKVCVNKNNFYSVLKKAGLIRFLFNAFIYAQKSHEEIQQYLFNLAYNLNLLPKKSLIKTVSQQMDSFFWCKCTNCFPRYPQNWDSQSFTKYLYETIDLHNQSQNPYLALVYFSVMNRRNMRVEVIKRFLRFILRTIEMMIPYAQRLILSRMYYYVYISYSLDHRISILKMFQNPSKPISFPKNERNLSMHRRLIYSYTMLSKHQHTSKISIDAQIQKRFMKQFYFYDYKYPSFVKEAYQKKLRRFYEVKENYYQFQFVKDMTMFKIQPYFLSQSQKCSLNQSHKKRKQ